jgi:CheY-like chemotaxis protein
VTKLDQSAKDKISVLIAEDEPLIRMAYADYLAECGYSPIEVGTGDAAVEILQENLAIQIGDGLQLQMKPQEVIRILGKPSSRVRDFFGAGGRIGYAYEKAADANDPALGQNSASVRQQGFTIYNELILNAAGGKLDGLLASRVTSN